MPDKLPSTPTQAILSTATQAVSRTATQAVSRIRGLVPIEGPQNTVSIHDYPCRQRTTQRSVLLSSSRFEQPGRIKEIAAATSEQPNDHEGVNALDIARYFLYKVDRESGDTISPLKLQKLVYYAQAWGLALKDQPLFFEDIQAWVHGPVVYDIWATYKEYKYGAIPEPREGLPEFTNDQLEVLDEVWNTYSELSAKHLEELTHSEPPWMNARKEVDAGESCQQIISLEDMKTYYRSLLAENSDGQKAS